MNFEPDQGVIHGTDETALPEEPRWGILGTILFGGAVIGLQLLVEWGMMAIFMLVETLRHPSLPSEETTLLLVNDGLLLVATLLTSAPICVGLICLAVKLRRGATLTGYLAAVPAPFKTMLVWAALMLVFAVVIDVLLTISGRPLVPPHLIRWYETARVLPLFWMAVIFAAPAFEEALFRGFLFEGFCRSRLGPIGAVVITSMLWAAMHTQYDLFESVLLFVGGVLIGVARWKTGSLYVCICMHSMINLISCIEVAVVVARARGAL
jgi:uncharacterized protein